MAGSRSLRPIKATWPIPKPQQTVQYDTYTACALRPPPLQRRVRGNCCRLKRSTPQPKHPQMDTPINACCHTINSAHPIWIHMNCSASVLDSSSPSITDSDGFPTPIACSVLFMCLWQMGITVSPTLANESAKYRNRNREVTLCD